MKSIYLFAAAATCSVAWGVSAPSVGEVELKQCSPRRAEISYVLSGAPAIVLLDLQTNTLADASGDWVSVGAEAIFGADNSCTCGANTLVAENGPHKINIRSPFFSGGAGVAPLRVRPVLKAVVPGNAPTYLVVRLAEQLGAKDRLMWFDEGSLPGGVLGNEDYRQTSLLLKRVWAKNVTFAAGRAFDLPSSTTGSITWPPHAFTFTNDFYMGVFEFTQKQWETVMGSAAQANYKVQGAMRPMEGVSFYDIRENAENQADERYEYPASPCPDSLLGKLRGLTACAFFPSGVDFDLPFESEWEYACRAGLPEGYWNNGVEPKRECEVDANMPGRCYAHGTPAGSVSPSVGPEGGTAICGTYEPSCWGFYDFHGNVYEWCLDWSVLDITQLAGLVNAQGKYLADGVTVGENRAVRGGSCQNHDSYCKTHQRYKASTTIYYRAPETRASAVGFRIKCRAGLK